MTNATYCSSTTIWKWNDTNTVLSLVVEEHKDMECIYLFLIDWSQSMNFQLVMFNTESLQGMWAESWPIHSQISNDK